MIGPGKLYIRKYIEEKPTEESTASKTGRKMEHLTIDETNHVFANVGTVNAGLTGVVVDIYCPEGKMLCIYSLRGRFADENDVEIPAETRIRITKERPSEYVYCLAKLLYSDMSVSQHSPFNLYRFEKSFSLVGGEHLRIYAIAPKINISRENVRFALECDLWKEK